ncbi:CzcE family metal-binding protein [Thioalkalivibrio sp.]|uniref:CzcE family metal-binding protein n=1 Tax=Thioalkalivibrio sp. TaxID=2093813 RepID=UPI0025D127BF|nr:CzcE family metal-binding protein [Thioalkalivibrio sp.]
MKTLRTFGSPIALAAALALAAPLLIANATASGLSVDRTIVIDSSTRSVHVNGGDVIRFNANGQSFDYRFNSFTQSRVYDLGKIAPPGALDRPVKVYVSADGRYTG